VSCPTEALFFSAATPEPLLLPKSSQALADYLPLLALRNSRKTAELLISVTTQGSDMGFTPLVCASDGSWAKPDWIAASRPARAKHAGHYFSL
jgi:hypothetical protein